MNRTPLRAATTLLLLSLACATLAGCVAMVGGAMVSGAVLIADRRTAGTQVDDQTIELRASNVVTATIADRGNVSATSYNRVLLLTGEVPTEADRVAVERAVAKIDNVRVVLNELAVMPNSTLTQRSNDTLITAKVKAAFVEAKDLQVASIKVLTERSTVYLMGLVSEAEANSAANVARGVAGVQKVVKVFEILTPAQLAALPSPPAAAASAPGK